MENMKIRIKQVSNNDPNADGEIITRYADLRNLRGYSIWEKLSELCDPGFHAVWYEIEKG